MSSHRTQAPAHHRSGWTALLILLCAGLVLGSAAYGAWWLAAWLSGDPTPTNPLAVAIGTTTFQARWSPLATAFTVITESALIGGAIRAARSWRSVSQLDQRATAMATPRELSEVAGRSAIDKAKRLRPDADVSQPGGIGLAVGTTVQGGVGVYQSWEDMLIAFAGPRTGKTAGLAIGAVIDGPGAVIATSSKRDLRDHTRGVREGKGSRVWESDLQGVTGDPHQEFCWNPLGAVTSLKAARRLAARFVAAERIEDARLDGYFDGGAAELLAIHFLAAAVAGGDILHAYALLSQEESQLAYKLLVDSGQLPAATKLRTAQRLYPKQRDGLYDVARRNLNVLTDPDYLRTVLPPRRIQIPGDTTELGAWMPTHTLPEFDPAAFVRSADVLYALSEEGADSAAALTTALVGRVIDEARALARRSPGGRMPVPMVAVLDEAANCCKLPDLPMWYSTLGSQGILFETYLHSPAQGARVWGASQLDEMVSAANIHYYGGSVKDMAYLETISKAIGEHDVPRWAASHSEHGVSHSQSWSTELAVPVSMLFQLPKDRAIVMTSGNAPVLVRKSFWTDRPDAAEIRKSNAKYGVDAEEESAKELL
ncbi:type IV secretory system conjugative DNA transfer family protein [Nocardia terpenica]|uniref:Type IV secretion system protein VirD4 n=1 Tax=Nocardia terpenica TaxID=455432 RepID=A0A291RY64_9NOCA|nr:TraM recognition domain-containing protein [Nocardia terpenica]ATL72483.1 type IV secretion system protein VirD4 [Nocardia terpenica]